LITFSEIGGVSVRTDTNYNARVDGDWANKLRFNLNDVIHGFRVKNKKDGDSEADEKFNKTGWVKITQ